MQITKLEFNWFSYSDSDGSGESNTTFTVGRDHITEIIQNSARGEGDRWYYDVMFEDGTSQRIFNPNRVYFAPDKP